jgi:fumarate reductase subunit C
MAHYGHTSIWLRNPILTLINIVHACLALYMTVQHYLS